MELGSLPVFGVVFSVQAGCSGGNLACHVAIRATYCSDSRAVTLLG